MSDAAEAIDTNVVESNEIESWDDAENYEPVEVSDSDENGEDAGEGDGEAEGESEESAADQSQEDSEEESDEQGDSESKEEVKEESKEGEESKDEAPALEKQIEDGSLEVKHTVDGKEVTVSLQELKNNYAGKVAWDKRFSELSTKEKSFGEEVEAINSYISTFSEKMKGGDAMGAIEYMASFTGLAPHQVKMYMLQSMKPEYDRLSQMSPELIESEYNAQESEFYRKQTETVSQQRSAEQAQWELQRTVEGIQQTHDIASEEWSEAEVYLKEHLEDGREMTPELIKDFIIEDRMYNRAESAIEAVDASYLTNDTFVETLKTIVQNNPEFTPEDIQKVVRDSLQLSADQETEKRLAEKVSKKKGNSKTETKQPEVEAIEDWDDIL